MSDDSKNPDDSIKRFIQIAGHEIAALFGQFTRNSQGLFKGRVMVTSMLDLPLAELDCCIVMDSETSLRLLTRDEPAEERESE